MPLLSRPLDSISMSLATYVENLQQKPEPFRQKLFYVLLALTMVMVFFVWLLQVHTTLQDLQHPTGEPSTTSPLRQIHLLTLEVLASIKSGLNQMR